MNAAVSSKRRSLEQELAPHVEKRWAENFNLELRLAGVAGTDIGAALAEVESHCAESGDDAADAFGPAIDYARELDLPRSEAQSHRRILVGVLPTLIQLAGMTAVVWSAPALELGEGLSATSGMLISLVVLATVLGVISLRPEPVLRLVVFRPWLAWVAMMAVMAAVVVPIVMMQQQAFAVPAAAALVCGAIVLLAGLVWDLLASGRASAETDEDILVAPLEGSEATQQRSRNGRWLSAARILLIPAATVVLATVGVILA